jgi:hypothetical protein
MNVKVSAECSEYERLRLQNIQRNDEYLAKIGFSRTSTNDADRKLRKRKVPQATEAVPMTAEPTRRSARVALLPIANYKESNEVRSTVSATAPISHFLRFISGKDKPAFRNEKCAHKGHA